MKKMLKLMSLLLAFALLFSVVTPVVMAEEESEAEEETTEEVVEDEAEGDEAEGEEAEGEEVDEEAVAEEEMEEIVDVTAEGEAGKVTNMMTMETTPANWNPHTYEQIIESELMDYLTTTLFAFDFEEDNFTSGFELRPLMLAELPTDVTAEYAGKYAVPEDAEEGYAYKYVLRDNLKWGDGTPITADDYEYSLQELLNPKMLNYRADEVYSGATVVHNAKNYLYQGSEKAIPLSEYIKHNDIESVDALLEKEGDMPAHINWSYSFGEIYKDGEWSKDGVEDTYVDAGMTIKEARELYIEKVAGEWGESEETAIQFFEDECGVMFKYPEVDFSEVGFDKTGDLEFVIIIDNPLVDFDFIWNMRNTIPLVYKPLYEENKKESGGLVTTTYNTSLETTMSYGPYNLVGFQEDKFFDLERNEHWFGWEIPELAEKWAEDRIYYQIVKNASTRYQMFLKGQLNSYGLTPDEAMEYRGSDYVVYTPSDFTAMLNIQANEQALKSRETPGINKTILTIKDFRQALVLALDREAYAASVTASSIPGYGLLNSMYIADPDTMTPYRDYDAAMQALCNVYGLEYGEDKEYFDLEEAYDALTAYDLDKARELVDSAVDQAIESGKMKEGDTVELLFSFGEDNEQSQREYNFFNEAWKTLFEGTKLEGKFTLVYDPTAGTKYGSIFKEGRSDFLIAGWSGARMDPFYLMEAYIGDIRYAQAYNPNGTKLTKEIDGEEVTLTVAGWHAAIMGTDPDHPFGKGKIDDEVRIEILAMIEEEILKDYTTSPLVYAMRADLFSQRISYYTDFEYHPILGYGHNIYHYDDAEWKEFVTAQGGTLDYH